LQKRQPKRFSAYLFQESILSTPCHAHVMCHGQRGWKRMWSG